MNYDSVVTTIGTILSLVGAGISIWQAKNAKSSAEIASKARRQFLAASVISPLSELKIKCTKVRDDFRKYSTADQIAGVNYHEDSNTIRILLDEINDAGGTIRLDPLTSILDEISKMSTHLDGAKTPGEALVPGKTIYEKMKLLIQIITKEISSNQDEAVSA